MPILPKVLNENIDAQTDALAITQNRFAKGLTSDLDVQQASTLLATTKAEISTLQTSFKVSIHRLDVLLGQQSEQKVKRSVLVMNIENRL